MADDLEDGEILDEDDEAVGNISSSDVPGGVDTKANELGGGVDAMGLSVCQSVVPGEKLQNDDTVQPDAGNVDRGMRRESRDGVDNHMLSDDDAHRKRKKRKKRHRESDDEERLTKESKRQKRSHHRSRRVGGDEEEGSKGVSGRTAEDEDDDEMMMFVRGASPTATHQHHHRQAMQPSPHHPAMGGGHAQSSSTLAGRRERKGSVRARRSSPLLQTPPEYMAAFGDTNASSASSPLSRPIHHSNARRNSRSPHNRSFRRLSRSPTVGHDGGQYDEHYESYESDYEREGGGGHFRRGGGSGMGRAEEERGVAAPRRGMEDRLLRKRRGGARGGRGSSASAGGVLSKRLGRKEKRGGGRGGGAGSEGGLLGKGRRGGPERSGSICMFFMQGKCQKGEDCPYSHDAVPPRKLELCKFYLMDCCAKKDKCLYMHKDFPCKYYHTGMKCFSGEKCKFSHGPLNDTLKAILLKHLETAPKEILGDFPRLTREGAAAMVMQQSANNSATRDKGRGRGMDGGGGEGAEGEEGEEAEGGSDNGHGNGKIPSLFEIDIPMPDDAREEGGEESGSGGGKRKAAEEEGGEVAKSGESREKRRRHRHHHRGHHHHHRGSEGEEEEEGGRGGGGRSGSGGQREGGGGRGLEGRGGGGVIAVEDDNDEDVEDDDDGGGDLSIVCEEEDEEGAANLGENGVRAEATEDERGGERASEGSPQADGEHKTRDAQGTELVGGDNSPVIPLHLPKKQRELFIRIQQQQRGADSSQSPSGDNNDGEEEGLKEESWYSSDEEAEDRSLTDVLKNLSKQPPGQPEKSTPVAVGAEKQEPSEQSNDSSSSSKFSMSGSKVLEALSLSDLSKIKITADISKLLSTIRESTTSALSGSKSPNSAPSESSATSDVDSRPQLVRDPRRVIPRDPRQQRTPTQTVSEIPRDPRTKPGMLSPRTTQIAYPSPMLSDHGDVDLRQLPEGDIDLRALVGKPRDTDLRSGRPFGDTDLRRPDESLGLPFRPVAPPEPATEIDASLNSHPPIPFRLIPVSPREGSSLSSPRSSRESLYSQLPRGFLPLPDTKVQNDPRMRKVLRIDDSTSQDDGVLPLPASTVPSSSGSPTVAVRVDPRKARQSSHHSANPQSPPSKQPSSSGTSSQPKDPRSKLPPPQPVSDPVATACPPAAPAQDPRLATRAIVLEQPVNKLPIMSPTAPHGAVFHPGVVNPVGMGAMVMSPGHMNPTSPIPMNHIAPTPMNPIAMGMSAMNTMGVGSMNMNPNVGMNPNVPMNAMGVNPGGQEVSLGGGMMTMGGGAMREGEMSGVRRSGPLLMDPPIMPNFGEMGEDDGGGMFPEGGGMYGGGGGMCNVNMMGEVPMMKGPRGSRGFFRGRGGGGRGRGGRGWRGGGGEGRGWRGGGDKGGRGRGRE